MLVGMGGFCWRSNRNIDIELHEPTPTDPQKRLNDEFFTPTIEIT
jgi:hypothetical protein